MDRRTTEADSHYDGLETLSVCELLTHINAEDRTVPDAVARALPQLEALINTAVANMAAGGRLFYVGAGTSGRLGVVDASECPPTFGVSPETVCGIIAGGDGAIRSAVEGAEDDIEQGWKDLRANGCDSGTSDSGAGVSGTGVSLGGRKLDVVIGLSASGTTPYVLGAVRAAREAGLATGCVVCNLGSPIAAAVEYPVEIVVGPEFITGSTRMKAGTAQKLALNMISTACLVRLGRVRGNKMVDMKLSNDKLVARGTRYVVEATGLESDAARNLLLKSGSVRAAIATHSKVGG